MKVAVIVDNLDPKRRRHCFWEEQLSSFRDIHVELITINKQAYEQKYDNLYIWDKYDIMIFNWDVINNDPVFDSDRSYQVVNRYFELFTQFVRDGGIIIIENQSWHWCPVQEAYDALFSGQVTVLKSTMLDNIEPIWSTSAHVSKQNKKHPLVHNLPKVLNSAYMHEADFEWVPSGSITSRALQGLHPTKIYSGAFKKWRPDWLPLIYSDDKKYPIMLVKTDDLGLWVVSTMFLASANINVLLQNLIIRAKNNLPLIKQHHSQYRIVRAFHALWAIAVLILMAVAVYEILALNIITLNIPFSNSIGGNIAISVLITGLLWIVSRIFNFIRSSLHTALNR